MKKFIYTILIIALLVLGWFLFNSRSFVMNNSNEPDKEDIEKSKNADLPKDIPDNWLNYKNSEYSFLIQHPNNWDAQEALKPQEPKALHEIVFSQQDYEMVRPSLKVQIFTNEENQPLEDWWQEWLADEDKEKEECMAENPNSPCLVLRDFVEKEEATTLAELPAKMVRFFRFDSEEECIFVPYGNYIYNLCYDGMNPNDPNFEINKKTTGDIRKTFGFYQPPFNVNDTGEGLVAGWQSVDDPDSVKVFKKDGTVEDVYQNNVLSTGQWKIVDRSQLVDVGEIGSNGTEVFLRVTIESEQYFYLVLDISDKDLTLSYLPRGNILSFEKIK